jgi:hypothetical protein
MHEKRPSEAEGLFSLIITLKKYRRKKYWIALLIKIDTLKKEIRKVLSPVIKLIKKIEIKIILKLILK